MVAVLYGQYDDAEKYFNRSLELKPDYPNAFWGRGWTYERQGKKEKAKSDLYRAGVLYYNKHNDESYELALTTFGLAIELDKNNPEYYTSRGWANYALKNYDDAIADFDKAVLIDKNYGRAYSGRGWVYKDQEKNDEAKTEFNQAAIAFRAKALNEEDSAKKEELYELALGEIDHALEIDKDYAEPYFRRGLIEVERLKYKEALDDFNQAIKLNISPDLIDNAYSELGLVSYKLKNYRDAIQYCDKAIEKNKGLASAYKYRALSYYALNDHKNAAINFKRLVKIDSEKEKEYEKEIKSCLAALGLDSLVDVPDLDDSDDHDPIPFPDIDKILLAIIIAIAFEFVLYIAYEVKSGTITGGVVVRKIVQILIISLIIFAIDAIAENISSDFNTYFLIGLFVIEIGLILDDAGNLGVPIPDDLKNFIKGLINKVERILRI